MKQTVKEYVTYCQVCQQAKPERVKYPGLPLPLPIPSNAWQVVTLDFIEGLPKSKHYNCILVVTGKFSKYAHFISLVHPFTALIVAQAYMLHIYKLHGLAKALISDRNRVFASYLWQELFRLSGTQLNMSSAYHPQSDGQTELMNQYLKAYLRCFVQACPKQWVNWLHLAEFWYNTCHHSSLNKSPFEVLYGHTPNNFGLDSIESCAHPELKDWLTERAKMMTALVQQQLQRAQQRMKVQADKQRTERSFKVGDFVFLKPQPYIQNSVVYRSNHKLAYRYFGPYELIKQINPVAYELRLTRIFSGISSIPCIPALACNIGTLSGQCPHS